MGHQIPDGAAEGEKQGAGSDQITGDSTHGCTSQGPDRTRQARTYQSENPWSACGPLACWFSPARRDGRKKVKLRPTLKFFFQQIAARYRVGPGLW